ncbi:rho GTPase-activating protein 26-like [Zerene cesonia]|uniref:rho GTPase-activating protein 26-like n=1 Tax=Zerene cesonia TaxID=33412 RepID=UPI0018E56F86|nr:rho GTPase-activating protein 26-like [Zerene cesonia]
MAMFAVFKVAGVSSKVSRLVAAGRAGRAGRAGAGAGAGAALAQSESRTLASALKAYLRALPDPLLTRRLHHQFLAAAKLERRGERVCALHALVHALPPDNYEMLRIVLTHLCNVAAKSSANLMSACNLSVCFGPTLLRAERETVASILELKFYNVLVEALIDHCHELFQPHPPQPPPPHQPHQPHAPHLQHAPHQQHQHPHMMQTSPSALPATARNDISALERGGLVSCGAGAGVGVGVVGAAPAAYAPHHHQLLQHFAPAPGSLLAHRGVSAALCSSSSESVSSHSASPPPRGPLRANGAGLAGPLGAAATRVRTLYACLGESEGELSFEPNQIITNVCPSGEPGWLRGSLNGKSGLVPENYVEPLP